MLFICNSRMLFFCYMQQKTAKPSQTLRNTMENPAYGIYCESNPRRYQVDIGLVR